MTPIKKSTLDFLNTLKENNDRDWFNANKALYNEARSNFEAYIQAVIDEVVKFDPILKGLEAKSCIFRINRDIRFSRDKSIYKTHMGAFIVRGGKNNGDKYAGYYVHVEPGNSMIGGGSYVPPSPWLNKIRENISENGNELLRIINEKEFVNIFKEIEGEKLKTSPKGYSGDHPFIDLLRFKSFLVTKMISDKVISSNEGFDLIVRACRTMKPFNDFLND